jgi:hypothetical protein
MLEAHKDSDSEPTTFGKNHFAGASSVVGGMQRDFLLLELTSSQYMKPNDHGDLRRK